MSLTGIDRKGIPVDSDARLLLFKKSKLIMQVNQRLESNLLACSISEVSDFQELQKYIALESVLSISFFSLTCLPCQAPVKSAKFKFNIEDGEYTCVAMLKGFMAFYDQECIIAGNKLKKNVVFSPFVAPGQMRVVLTWGEAVKDLDSYMLVP